MAGSALLFITACISRRPGFSGRSPGPAAGQMTDVLSDRSTAGPCGCMRLFWAGPPCPARPSLRRALAPGALGCLVGWPDGAPEARVGASWGASRCSWWRAGYAYGWIVLAGGGGSGLRMASPAVDAVGRPRRSGRVVLRIRLPAADAVSCPRVSGRVVLRIVTPAVDVVSRPRRRQPLRGSLRPLWLGWGALAGGRRLVLRATLSAVRAVSRPRRRRRPRAPHRVGCSW